MSRPGSSEQKTPKASGGRQRRASILVALLALALVLGIVWWRFPVSVATPPATAPSFEELDETAARLTLPAGFKVDAYAAELGRVRSVVVTDSGDLIVAAPPSNVLLVRAEEEGSGRAGEVTALLGSLDNPSGLYLDGDQLYLAEEGRILRVGFDTETDNVAGPPEVVITGLPRGGHWTRTIKKGPDGFFYVTIGSSCNVCIEEHAWRAAMIRFKPGEELELYATGLRNTVGFDWQPGTGDLYGVDNGRDWLGDDFPPERVNRIVQGGFYGWPYFNGDNEPDPDYGAQGSQLAEDVIPPAHTLPAHVAPLAITFLRQAQGALEGAALVSQHGSWNRSQKDGYRVVSLHWQSDGSIVDRPFLEGFLERGRVFGRPVDIAEGEDGTIYISDDFNGAIWRVTPAP